MHLYRILLNNVFKIYDIYLYLWNTNQNTLKYIIQIFIFKSFCKTCIIDILLQINKSNKNIKNENEKNI